MWGSVPAGKNMQSAEITVEFLPNQIGCERLRVTACDSAFARTQGWLHWRALYALDGKKKPGASQETPDSGDPPTQGMRALSYRDPRPGQRGSRSSHGFASARERHGRPFPPDTPGTTSGCSPNRWRQRPRAVALAGRNAGSPERTPALPGQHRQAPSGVPEHPLHPHMQRVVRPSISAATRVRPARSPFARCAPEPGATGPRWFLPG